MQDSGIILKTVVEALTCYNELESVRTEMTQKILVSDNNMATFVCPECNASKNADISRYKKLENSVRLKIKCVCGNSYPVVLERRSSYRKETSLPGKYIFRPSGGPPQKGAMTVLDISRGGLKFKATVVPKLKPGDTFGVEFNLDDKQQTLIRKKVVARNVTGRSISVAFCSFDTSDPGDKALGFYLF